MTNKLKPDAAAPSPFAQLFSPISADLPCGADLEYDPAFLLLLARLQPREATELIEIAETIGQRLRSMVGVQLTPETSKRFWDKESQSI